MVGILNIQPRRNIRILLQDFLVTVDLQMAANIYVRNKIVTNNVVG